MVAKVGQFLVAIDRRSVCSGGRGTTRSSEVGGRPIIAAHPVSFHVRSIAASVGCTGM